MKLSRLSIRIMGPVFVASLLAINFLPAAAITSEITSLSASTQTRSGRLRIFGTGFGTDGQVLIDGQSSPIADWADDLIVAYVPEAAQLGTVTVQVVTPEGNSNVVSLDVTTRPTGRRARWHHLRGGCRQPLVRIEPGWRAEVDRARWRQGPHGGQRWDDLYRVRGRHPSVLPGWNAQMGIYAGPVGVYSAGPERGSRRQYLCRGNRGYRHLFVDARRGAPLDTSRGL